jgi:L-asparaginase
VPVILVGAMRPASAVGSDGLRNLANALRVAGDPHAAGRGVLVVMDDSIFSARDVRKARTQGTQAFRSFPRGPVGSVTPANLEWFGGPWRDAGTARFDLPEVLPNVPIIHAAAGMDAGMVHALEDAGAQGFVLAGMGNGNAPRAVLDALAASVQRGLPVVRSTRSDQGLVERNIEVDDDACGFIAARALNPAKARILLQLLIAHHRDTPELAQAAFDTR